MKKKSYLLIHSHRQKIVVFLTVLLSLIPLFDILMRVMNGDFAFWYDPARDLLAGLANLQKPSLIGPTSGIPGVFYGPYWIWLLSFGQLFSDDPRIVTLVAMTLPYLILFPLILARFSRVFSYFTIAILWLLFLLSYSNYFTDLWNPHIAPLLVLLTIYLLFTINHYVNKKNIITILVSGFSSGLVMNFHLSFGIGMMLGISIYLLVRSICYIFKSKQKYQAAIQQSFQLVSFFAGVVIAFFPSILFEIRHQFQQTTALLQAFSSYGAVVELPGLSISEIIRNFFERGADLLQISLQLFVFLLTATITYYILQLKKTFKERKKELKLFVIVLSIIIGIFFIYLTARNPIWEYHFIGVEILFLLLIGILINHTKALKTFLGVWVVFLVIQTGISLWDGMHTESRINPGNLNAKEATVKTVIADAGDTPYTVYAYNDAIYVYDYSYLFKLFADKDVPYDPGDNPPNPDVIYLIIPENAKNQDDFINFRANEKTYRTIEAKILSDETRLIKKAKKEE